MNGKTRFSATRRTATGLVALAAAGMLATACGSSASTGTSSTAATTTTAAGATGSTSTTAGSTGATGATGATGNSTTTSTTSAGGLGSAFLGKFQSGEHLTFTATYTITSSSGTDKLTSLTIAQQSPNQLFKAVTTTGTFEFLTIGTKSYLCSQTAGKWICLNGGKSLPEADLFAVYEPGTYLPLVQAAAKDGAHASYSTKTVNGFPLQCVTVTGATGQKGTGTFCVTSQGVLGYVSYSGTGSGSGSFSITNFSGSVPGSDFTLPAKPTAT